jgi:DNA-binding NarL/FixJ family response regulator
MLFLLTQILAYHSSMALVGIPGIEEGERAQYLFAILAVHLVVFSVIGLIWCQHSLERVVSSRLSVLAAAVVGCTGFMLLRATPFLGFLPVSPIVLIACLIGGAMAFSSLYWLQRLALFTYRGSYLYILGAHAGATCLCALLLFMPVGFNGVVAPLCFALSALCSVKDSERPLHTASENVANSRVSVTATLRRFSSMFARVRSVAVLLWRGVFSVCIFAFLSGLMSRLSGQTTANPETLQSFVLITSAGVLAIMSIPALLTNKPLKLESSYFVALPLSALSLLIVPSLIRSLPVGMSGILVTTGYMLVGIVLYCTIAEVSRFSGIPAALPLSVCGALTVGFCLLGLALARPVSTLIPAELIGPLIIGCALLYLVVLGAVSLLEHSRFSATERLGSMGRGVGDEMVFAADSASSGDSADGIVVSSDVSVVNETSDAFTSCRSRDLRRLEELGLSARECAIVPLVLRGRTLSRIGDDLHLSTSAVKYHIQSVYRKLGVHSRDELLQVVLDGPEVLAVEVKLPLAGYALTAREEQVCGLLLQGRSVAGIAEALSVSQNTAKTYIKRIYQKSGVHSKQELLDLHEGRTLLENGPHAV